MNFDNIHKSIECNDWKALIKCTFTYVLIGFEKSVTVF